MPRYSDVIDGLRHRKQAEERRVTGLGPRATVADQIRLQALDAEIGAWQSDQANTYNHASNIHADAKASRSTDESLNNQSASAFKNWRQRWAQKMHDALSGIFSDQRAGVFSAVFGIAKGLKDGVSHAALYAGERYFYPKDSWRVVAQRARAWANDGAAHAQRTQYEGPGRPIRTSLRDTMVPANREHLIPT